MAKYRNPEKTETFGEDFRRDDKAERDESCNAYYTRKQRSKQSDLAPDCEAEFSTDAEDQDAEVRNYKSDRNAGPMNYKKWDRYGK